MEKKEQHSDKCCYWDDEEFCDCGEREINKLQAENQRLTSLCANYRGALKRAKHILEDAATIYHDREALTVIDAALQRGGYSDNRN